MYFAIAVFAILVIVLCVVIIACCRRNKGELTTVHLEKELDQEQQLAEYKRRKQAMTPGSEMAELDMVDKQKRKSGKKKAEVVEGPKKRDFRSTTPTKGSPYKEQSHSRLGVTEDVSNVADTMQGTNPQAFVLQQGATWN